MFNIKIQRRMLSHIIALALSVFAAYSLLGQFELSTVSGGSAYASGYVMVIDPGHGGEDGGASAENGTLESALNLEISLRLQSLAGLWGVQTVMTRQSDVINYPESAATTRERKVYDQKSRVELINSVDGAFLISIHQNKYPDPRPRGAQVFYAKTSHSLEMGETLQENLIRQLFPESRRVSAPAPDSVYLMKKVTCPAVLVECGFLSNPEEVRLLETPEYQLKIAALVLGTFLQYTVQ